MENLPRSGLAAPGEVCFSFLERGGEFESSRLLKTAKTAVFASLVRYFYFTPPNSSILSQLFLFSSKPCFLCAKIPHQSAGFLLASRLSTKLGRSAGTRTLGLLLPKQARYQLRNTPAFLNLTKTSRLQQPGSQPTPLHTLLSAFLFYSVSSQSQDKSPKITRTI